MVARVAFVAVVVLAVGCASHRVPVVVSKSGRIGTLRVDHADAEAVIAATGRPDVDRREREFDSEVFRALAYDCSESRSDTACPLGRQGPYCRTVFFINGETGRLGSFFTSSPRYVEAHGVHIGMPTAAAERLLRKLVYSGCEDNIYLGNLTVAFTGGVPRKLPGSSGLHLIGGNVFAFVLHSRRNDVGVFDCL